MYKTQEAGPAKRTSAARPALTVHYLIRVAQAWCSGAGKQARLCRRMAMEREILERDL